MDATRKFILTKSLSESQNSAMVLTWTLWIRYVLCIVRLTRAEYEGCFFFLLTVI